MKKSKKLLVFLLSAMMVCAAPVVITACDKDKDDGTKIEETEPSKIKDGIALSVKKGESTTVKVSDYINANGKTVTAESTNPAVAEVKLDSGVVTVTGKAKGTATLKLKCESVTVSFNITVTAEEAGVTPAPVFENVTKNLDLRLESFIEVELAPKSGGDKFNLEYSLANVFGGAEIKKEEGKLKFTPTATGSNTIAIKVKYTEKNDAQNTGSVTFNVTVNVTRSEEPKTYFTVTVDGEETQVEEGATFTLPAYEGAIAEGKEFDGWQVGSEKKAAGDIITVTGNVTVTSTFKNKVYTVTVDGAAQQVEHGTELTLSEYEGTVAEGKVFDGWQVGSEKKAAGDKITVTGNLTITSTFKNKVYTVTIDGAVQQVEHGEKITLPAYEKEVESGKQFAGWTDGTDTFTAGSQITVTGNLTITAIIEDVPQTPPELVKDTDTVALALETKPEETLDIADYIVTNGHAVRVENSDPEAVSVSSTLTQITLTAVAHGNSTVTITCGTLTVTITVTVAYPPSQVVEEEVVDTTVYDLYAGELILNLAENVTNIENVTGYKVNGENTDGSTYKVTGSYTETAQEVTFTVTVLLGDTESLEYTYKVTVKDTTAYRVINGSFNDDLQGWTLSDNENPIGEISENDKFWENLPMFNDGKYFRGESKEGNTGTLTSSEFKIGGINKISFKLGAGNGCYVTLEKADGTVLALWRNYKFEDIGGGWDSDKIGTEQFALNLVTYVADLTEWAGETVRLVINDESTGGIGFVTFDELITYYYDESELPQGYEAINELADITEINAKIAEASAIERGDYTQESFAALTDKISKARELAGKKGVTAQQLTNAIAEIEAAIDGLTVRVPEVKEGSKTVAVKSGAEITVNPLNYVDIKELSSISYTLTTESGNLTIDELKITAADVEIDTDETVTLTVKYKDEEVLTVELTVKITSGDKPVVSESAVSQNIDVYNLTDKEKIKLDFAANIENPANLTLKYTVKIGETPITLDSENCYEYTLKDGDYNDVDKEVVFNVTVGSEENSLTVSYTYTLYIKDTTEYRVKNGSFEDDLTDWEQEIGTTRPADQNRNFGAISNESIYWAYNATFNKDGDKFFSGWKGEEDNMGALTSSAFKVSESGWITFKLGGGKNKDHCYVEIIDAQTGKTLARYGNHMFSNANEGELNAHPGTAEQPVNPAEYGVYMANMVLYKAQLSVAHNTSVRIRVVDKAYEDWGVIFVDGFTTYYDDENSIPEEAIQAVNLPVTVTGEESQNQIINGGFETGDLYGWTVLTDNMNGVASVIGKDVYWGEKLPYNQSGKYHLDGWYTNLEEAQNWAIRSSTFTLGGSGFISVKMGGHAAAVKVFKADGTPVGVYKANHFNDANFPFEGDGDGKGSWACMRTYFIDLHDLIGEQLYVELHDVQADGWAHAFFDDVVTYYEAAPDIANGYDTVTAPVSREEDETLVYGEVQLKWRLAVKENENN